MLRSFLRGALDAKRSARHPSAFDTYETRKLAAILVADAVGYSRLAGADKAPALAALRSALIAA
jgi:class 3 adenylate cyclase